MLKIHGVDISHFNLLHTPSIQSQRSAGILLQEVQELLSQSSLFRDSPVEILDGDTSSLESFKGVEALLSDTLEDLHVFEFGEELMQDIFLLHVVALVALESGNFLEPGEVVISKDHFQDEGGVAIIRDSNSEGVNGVELSELLHILLG